LCISVFPQVRWWWQKFYCCSLDEPDLFQDVVTTLMACFTVLLLLHSWHATAAVTVTAVILCISGLLVAILEELVASGRLAGTLTGSRHDKAMYIPDVYIKAQSDWVDNFYRQNGYLGKYLRYTQLKKIKLQ